MMPQIATPVEKLLRLVLIRSVFAVVRNRNLYLDHPPGG